MGVYETQDCLAALAACTVPRYDATEAWVTTTAIDHVRGNYGSDSDTMEALQSLREEGHIIVRHRDGEDVPKKLPWDDFDHHYEFSITREGLYQVWRP